MKRFSRNYWILFLFIGVTVIGYLTAGASAAVPQNQSCLQCHSNIWGTTPPVDRTIVCGKCHNALGQIYHPNSNAYTPYGYFKYPESAYGSASIVHPPHNGTNLWAGYTDIGCASCHAKADCKVCHTNVPHSTHSQPTKTFACVDCHKNVTVNNKPTGEFTQPNCTSCHAAHAAGCSLCHGTKYTMKDWQPGSHMKHEGKVLCGACHGIPEKTALDSSGKYCAICHGKPMPYRSGNVAEIHKKHADKYGYSPDACMSCHGKSVPAITPKTSCSVCHGTKYTATRMSTSKIHDEHKDEIDCAICHPGQVLPVTTKTACTRCHEPESYRTPNDVHEEHGKLWCDVCHDSNIPQGVKCADCHGNRFVRPTTYTTYALHKDHAGSLMPCSVCHAGLGSSSVSTSLSGSQSQDQAISSISSAYTPTLGVITVVALSIALCVVFLKRAKKHL